jgi:hypothetical protein
MKDNMLAEVGQQKLIKREGGIIDVAAHLVRQL